MFLVKFCFQTMSLYFTLKCIFLKIVESKIKISNNKLIIRVFFYSKCVFLKSVISVCSKIRQLPSLKVLNIPVPTPVLFVSVQVLVVAITHG